MPRNVNGTYSLPLPPVVSNTTIEADWANTTDDDIAQALTDSLDRNGRGGMAGPFRLVDGTVSAPGLAFTAETGTGLFRESAGVMGMAVQGAKVGQWSSAGLIIPNALSVQGAAALNTTLAVGLVTPDNARVIIKGVGSAGVAYDKTELQILDPSGLNSPKYGFYVQQQYGTGLAGKFTVGVNDTNNHLYSLAFATGGSERMQIAPTGAVSVAGQAAIGGAPINPASALSITSGGFHITYMDLAASFFWNLYLNGTNGAYEIGNGGGVGVFLSQGATTWSGLSDERVKTALVPITDALAKVATLRAVTGRFIKDEPSVSRSMLIAQDVQAVLPEAVQLTGDGMLGLSYTDVIPLLVAAIKELNARLH